VLLPSYPQLFSIVFRVSYTENTLISGGAQGSASVPGKTFATILKTTTAFSKSTTAAITGKRAHACRFGYPLRRWLNAR
jgi:hypothetical protein